MNQGFRIKKIKYVIRKKSGNSRTIVLGGIRKEDIDLIEKGNNIDFIIGYLNSTYLTKLLRARSNSSTHAHVLIWRDLLNEDILLPSKKIQDNIIVAQNESNKLLEIHKKDLESFQSKIKNDLFQYPDRIVTILESILEFKKMIRMNDKIHQITQKILIGESETLEFKETFNIDAKTKKQELYIQESTLKNIVGFLNSQGGEIYVGVNDEGEITGIEMDNYKSDDKYLLNFKNHIKSKIGEEYYPLIKWELITITDKKILTVNVKQSYEPVFLYGKDFYVRTSPAVDKLEGKKQYEYIKKRFANS